MKCEVPQSKLICQEKYVQYVTNHSPGEKNGELFGRMLNIVQNDVDVEGIVNIKQLKVIQLIKTDVLIIYSFDSA